MSTIPCQMNLTQFALAGDAEPGPNFVLDEEGIPIKFKGIPLVRQLLCPNQHCRLPLGVGSAAFQSCLSCGGGEAWLPGMGLGRQRAASSETSSFSGAIDAGRSLKRADAGRLATGLRARSPPAAPSATALVSTPDIVPPSRKCQCWRCAGPKKVWHVWRVAPTRLDC